MADFPMFFMGRNYSFQIVPPAMGYKVVGMVLLRLHWWMRMGSLRLLLIFHEGFGKADLNLLTSTEPSPPVWTELQCPRSRMPSV